jgi:hypothetical protein
MEFAIVAAPASSLLTVSIVYDLPERRGARLLGRLFGGFYARWCTNRMASDAARRFSDFRQGAGLSGAQG